MEEVDKIIIHSLRDIGCQIDEDVEGLSQFSAELIVEAAVKCLDILQPDHGITPVLSHNVATRFHVAASIAQSCQDLGYNGEVGYQTFLYVNTNEIRRVFMFLIEKLPKEEIEEILHVPDDPFLRMKHEIRTVIKQQMSERRKPGSCVRRPFISVEMQTGVLVPGQKMRCTPQEWKEYCTNELPFLTEQGEPGVNLPSIISLNSRLEGEKRKLVRSDRKLPSSKVLADICQKRQKNTWFGLKEDVLSVTSEKPSPPIKTEAKAEESEEERQNKEEETINLLQSKIENLQLSIKTLRKQIQESRTVYEAEAARAKDSHKKHEARRKALELLPNAEENLKKLQEAIDTGKERLILLSEKWEQHRKPLIEQYRDKRKQNSQEENENQLLMETTQALKDKLSGILKQISQKEALRVKLEAEVEKQQKGFNRSAYTRRIMEIIGNIKKQEDEINKTLLDTKELQKDINFHTGKVDRTFTVAKDAILANAKKDEDSRRCYKLLLTLHADCSDIISMVQETGAVLREIKELEEQIDHERSKNVSANLERITADLEQMKMESLSLTKLLKNSN